MSVARFGGRLRVVRAPVFSPLVDPREQACPECGARPGVARRDLRSKARRKPAAARDHAARGWRNRRCKSCKAPPGQPCVSRGVELAEPHTPRRRVTASEARAWQAARDEQLAQAPAPPPERREQQAGIDLASPSLSAAASAPTVEVLPARAPGDPPPVAEGRVLAAPGGLLEEALAVSAEHARVNTQRAYATSYRALHAFATARLGGRAPRREDVDRDLVVAFRDQLVAGGAATSTVSVRLSAIRRLADALELDPRIHRVKTKGAESRPPGALSLQQYQALLDAPDLRTAIGLRDRAMMCLGGDAGCGARRSSP